MNQSILNTIKKLLGLTTDYTEFDLDILTHINSALGTLTQLGVGPAAGFYVDGTNETWGTFLGPDLALAPVKSYVYLRCRLLFDPPTNSFAVESMQKQILELEWRLNVLVDPPKEAAS